MRYRFVRVTPRKLFGLEPVYSGTRRARVTDLEKTLLDTMDHPEHAGGMVEAAKAVRSAWPNIRPDRLLAYGDRMGNSAVFKRLGYLLEQFELANEDYLEALRRQTRPGLSKLEPLNPSGGRCCTRWGLRLNVDLQDLERWRES